MSYWEGAQGMVIDYGMKLVYAIIVLVVGLWIIKAISNGFRKLMLNRKIDASLVPFLTSLINMVLKVLLVITVMSMLGIQMTSFIALLGAAGLAVGMALSGTLQNFAGGVMILIFKPFKVGDFIDAQGFQGTVHEIQIFITILLTLDNKTVIIPNGGLSNGSVVNYSTQASRRIDWTFGIAYGDKTEEAKKILMDLIIADKRILDEPEPFVGVKELGDSSVNFTARGWIKQADYWDVFFDMNESVYNTFNEKGISIPFPQMDVHLDKA